MLIAALLLLIASGILTGLCGVAYSRAARSGIDSSALLLASSALVALVAFAVFPDYTRLFRHTPPATFSLAAIIFVAGLFCALGILLMNSAMKGGHHGMAWAISQACLLWPLVALTLIFHAPLGAPLIIGAVCLLCGIAAIAVSRVDGAANITNNAWLGQALAAFVLCGLQQTLLTIPSNIPALADTCRIRIPLVQAACALVYYAVWRLRGCPTGAGVLGAAIKLAGLVLIIYTLLFRGLDILGRLGMSGIGYPVVVGSCIVCFAVYSAFILREPTRHIQWVGVFAITIGIALIAFR